MDRAAGGGAGLLVFLPMLLLLAGCDGGVNFVGDGGVLSETWVPPIADVTPGGWRDSSIPWEPAEMTTNCAAVASTTVDLWASPESIYLAWGWTTDVGYDEFAGVVFRNSGDGWTEYYRAECPDLRDPADMRCVRRIAAGVGDRLLVRMFGVGMHDPLAYLDAAGSMPWPTETWGFADPFVVDDDLGYAVWPGTDTKLVRFDGTTWTPVPEPIPFDLPYQLAHVIWADADNVFVAGERATVLSLETDGWRIHELETLGRITALWGFAANDVWAADDLGGLFHWDGSAWSPTAWPNLAPDSDDACAGTDYIAGLWGADGVLFLHTGRELLRWEAGAFSVLGYWPGVPTVADGCVGGVHLFRLRGTSPNDVFVAAAEPLPGDHDFDDSLWSTDAATLGCISRPFVLYWDGSVFHWL